MHTFSSVDAANHFGELIDAARLAPVVVTNYDKPFVVVMLMEEFGRLTSKISSKKSNLILRKRGQ
jgi:hypothetical protein